MGPSRGGSYAGQTRLEKLDQLSNFRRYRCSNHSGDCGPSMGEHDARSQQSRTKRNTGINGARPNPTASRSHHRNGALTAYQLGKSALWVAYEITPAGLRVLELEHPAA
jgi:hypothetical protein